MNLKQKPSLFKLSILPFLLMIISSSNLVFAASPVINTHTITPASPIVAQDISAVIGASDADGPFTVIYNWLKDGSSITVLNLPFEGNGGSESTNVLDYSGNGNNGTVTGATWATTNGNTGSDDGGYAFNGSNNYITVPYDASLDLTEVTVELWTKPNSGALTPSLSILQKDYSSCASPWSIWGFETGNDIINWTLSTGNGPRLVVSSDTLTDDGTNWFHVVGTYDGSNMRIYINGVESSVSPTAQTGTMTTSNGQLSVGRFSGCGGQYYYPGLVDNVIIYNSALSDDQITQLYNDGVNNESLKTIDSSETVVGENWTSQATANDFDTNSALSTVVASISLVAAVPEFSTYLLLFTLLIGFWFIYQRFQLQKN